VSFQEIYLDSIRDLLDSTNVLNSNANSCKYEPTVVQVKSFKNVFELLKKAEKNRSTAVTVCNEKSSRSHTIFQIKLKEGQTLSLVDLAGSERLDSTKTEGDRLKESLAINKSLSALADVISAMKEKKHVPYRNSKLTFVL
jgi:kinesin family member C1